MFEGRRLFSGACRGVWPRDECADETIDRLSRKLAQARVDDVKSYAHGIARLVLLERRHDILAGEPAPLEREGHTMQDRPRYTPLYRMWMYAGLGNYFVIKRLG